MRHRALLLALAFAPAGAASDSPGEESPDPSAWAEEASAPAAPSSGPAWVHARALVFGDALSLYAGLAERDPDNDALRRAYREILLAHASRLELSHATLFQLAATHHTEEVAWKTRRMRPVSA